MLFPSRTNHLPRESISIVCLYISSHRSSTNPSLPPIAIPGNQVPIAPRPELSDVHGNRQPPILPTKPVGISLPPLPQSVLPSFPLNTSPNIRSQNKRDSPKPIPTIALSSPSIPVQVSPQPSAPLLPLRSSFDQKIVSPLPPLVASHNSSSTVPLHPSQNTNSTMTNRSSNPILFVNSNSLQPIQSHLLLSSAPVSTIPIAPTPTPTPTSSSTLITPSTSSAYQLSKSAVPIQPQGKVSRIPTHPSMPIPATSFVNPTTTTTTTVTAITTAAEISFEQRPSLRIERRPLIDINFTSDLVIPESGPNSEGEIIGRMLLEGEEGGEIIGEWEWNRLFEENGEEEGVEMAIFEMDGDGLSSTPLWKSVSSADAKGGSNSNDEERDQAHEEKERIAHSVGLQR